VELRDAILQQLGKTLQHKRVAQNISQEQIAMRMGVNQSYISLLEKGKTNPTYLTLVQYAQCLGYGMPKILFLHEEMVEEEMIL
jgi:transcriptional regulator with XRE-family HTH domain